MTTVDPAREAVVVSGENVFPGGADDDDVRALLSLAKLTMLSVDRAPPMPLKAVRRSLKRSGVSRPAADQAAQHRARDHRGKRKW
jgi:hypothetical protein